MERLGPSLRLAAALGVLAMVASSLAAVEITVAGGCTLVDAIEAAVTDTVRGGCPAGNGADRIVLGGSVGLSTVDWVGVNGPRGLPLVTGPDPIVIDGQGLVIFRTAGAPAFNFFQVSPSGHLTLVDLLLFAGAADGSGGAIRNGGFTHLQDVTLWLNSATATGGGIFNEGTLIVEDSLLLANTAPKGGAIANEATASIVRTELRSNTAPSVGGGGVYNKRSASLGLALSLLKGNGSSAPGAGVLNHGSATVVSSLFQENETSHNGGGFVNGASGEALIVNSTFSGNIANTASAIKSEGDTLTVRSSTLSGNRCTSTGSIHTLLSIAGSDTHLEATIVADSGDAEHCNTDHIADDEDNFGCYGSEVTGFDTVLRDNGGPTFSHALYGTSNAIDAAGACGLPADQRGVAREGSCDSGAFEYGACGDFVLRDQDVTGFNPLAICEHVWIGPEVTVVAPAGDLRIRVGRSATIRNGFAVEAGSDFTLRLDPTLLP